MIAMPDKIDTGAKPDKPEFIEECSYCSAEVVVPDGFMPDDLEKVQAEKYDEKTGSFLVVKTVALLACTICHHNMFTIKKPRRTRR